MVVAERLGVNLAKRLGINPFDEASVARAATAELPGDGIPLAARAQSIDDSAKGLLSSSRRGPRPTDSFAKVEAIASRAPKVRQARRRSRLAWASRHHDCASTANYRQVMTARS